MIAEWEVVKRADDRERTSESVPGTMHARRQKVEGDGSDVMADREVRTWKVDEFRCNWCDGAGRERFIQGRDKLGHQRQQQQQQARRRAHLTMEIRSSRCVGVDPPVCSAPPRHAVPRRALLRACRKRGAATGGLLPAHADAAIKTRRHTRTHTRRDEQNRRADKPRTRREGQADDARRIAARIALLFSPCVDAARGSRLGARREARIECPR